MEDKENNLIIEVRKPDNTEENIPHNNIDNNVNEDVEKINDEPQIQEKQSETPSHLDEIQAQVLKFQEEVSKFQNEINKDKIRNIEVKEEPNQASNSEVQENSSNLKENAFNAKEENSYEQENLNLKGIAEKENTINESQPETVQHIKGNVTSNEITSTAQGITDAIVQRLETENNYAYQERGIKFHFNLKKELKEINCKTIFEFKKTIYDFDINKVKIYNINDDGKVISFLFHDGDFFAINRINFPDGYEYTEKNRPLLSENLNGKIRKIPNVAKTRNILGIEDIETRIFDMTQYILLLSKKGQEIRILKVNNGKEISDIEFVEEKFDKREYIDIIDDYELIEEELDREENSFSSKFSRVKEKILSIVVNPFKILKEKLAKTKDIKLLSDGRTSVFDNDDEQ